MKNKISTLNIKNVITSNFRKLITPSLLFAVLIYLVNISIIK